MAFDPDKFIQGGTKSQFDPDAFLAKKKSSTFDPDAFLAKKKSSTFDPDAFLAKKKSSTFDPDAFLKKHGVASAATAPAVPAPAQAVASAPVIPSAPASPVAAAPIAAPSAEPAPAAPPAAPRFGQPGYNPLLHGGDSKPPLDLRIKRALGIKDYRDEGPPTMSEVLARQSAPAAQSQAPVNPVMEPEKMPQANDPLTVAFGPEGERMRAGIDQFIDELSAPMDETERRALLLTGGAATKVRGALQLVGRAGNLFESKEEPQEGDFIRAKTLKDSLLAPFRRLRGQTEEPWQIEIDRAKAIHQTVQDAMAKYGVPGAFAAQFGIMGYDLAVYIAMAKTFARASPWASSGSVNTASKGFMKAWAARAAKEAPEVAKMFMWTYTTTPGTHEERVRAARVTAMFRATPMLSMGMPTNFLAMAADTALNQIISLNVNPVYAELRDNAKEAAKERGIDWDKASNVQRAQILRETMTWQQATEVAFDVFTNVLFAQNTKSATKESLRGFLNEYGKAAEAYAAHLKSKGINVDATRLTAEGARQVAWLPEMQKEIMGAQAEIAPKPVPQANERLLAETGLRQERVGAAEELDAIRAAAAEALGTSRIGAEAQMEAERVAVPVPGDAWRQMAGVEAPSSAARVNPLLEPERVAQATTQATAQNQGKATSQASEQSLNLKDQAKAWDQQNRMSRSDAWFEGANINESARRGFTDALQAGGDRLAAHGMAKERTLGGAVQNLIGLLQNGLDANRRGGKLDTAALVSGDANASGGATASGGAYTDGPFVLVARPGQELSGNLSGLGAVLINESHAEIADALRQEIQRIRPDIIVDSYSNAGNVTRQLIGQTSTLTTQEAADGVQKGQAQEVAQAIEPMAADVAKAPAAKPAPEEKPAALEAARPPIEQARAAVDAVPPKADGSVDMEARQRALDEWKAKNPEAVREIEGGEYSDLRSVFPNATSIKPATVRFTDQTVDVDDVTLPDGKHVFVARNRSGILIDLKHVSETHGIPLKTLQKAAKEGRINVGGKFRDLGDNHYLIEVDPSNRSLGHEAFHFMAKAVLTPEQNQALLARYGSEEKAADAYNRMLNVGGRNSLFDNVRAFVDKLLPGGVKTIAPQRATSPLTLRPDGTLAGAAPPDAPRTAADLAKPAQAQEPARVAEPAQKPAPEKPTTPLARAIAEAPQAFRVTSSRGNVHNVKMPDGIIYPIRAESKAEAIAKAQALASKVPLSKMNDSELRKRAEELGVPYDPKSTAKELRDRIRAVQQGGFIDVSPRAPSKDDHPFVRQMKENDRRVHEWQKRHTRDAISALRSEIVDRQADVKRALKGIGANDAIRRLVLRQGSGAEAARQFRVAEKSITDILPTRDRELFKYYLQAMRVVEATQVQAERGIELKSPMSAEDAKRFLNDYFVKLPQEQQDAVMGAAKKYWGVMREQLDALYAEGLIGKEGYEAIATKHQFYSPRRFVEFIDPQTIKPNGEMRHDSGVDALDKGSESAMAADPMYLMAHVITRTQNRLFKNRANKALYDTAIASPENSIVRVLGKNETPTRTEDSVSVFIDGQEVRMAMPKELAAEWDGLPPALSRNIAELLQWASGTKVLKTLATGVNPEFAISNLPRDAMYAWFTSGQYSSFLPKALGQLFLDYKRSMRDAIKRTGAYTDYVKEGGGMDFLTTQGMTRKPGIEGEHRLARKIGDILAWAGETSEIATRLAVRNRAIRNGLSPEEATYVARNMLDFSQGGTFAKAADNVIPYLNAAIQGTRGGFRAFKENPKVASFKAAQLIAIGYGLAQVAATFTPELWDSINEREKASKWIIPLSWTRKDKEGNDRHAYIAIPKDQFQQVFAAIGQSFVDAVRGNPWKPQIIDSLFSTIPVEASSTVPPIMNAALAYFGNYDTWTKENVWQGYEDISPSKEQSWQTPEIAVDIAELASRMGVEISPERLATATGKVVPTSNPLGSIMSSIYATGNPDPELGRTIVEKLRDIPGIRRILRFSRPSNLQKFTMDKAYQYNVDVAGMTDLQAREAIKVAERKRADVRYPLNIEADKIARQAVRGDVSSDDLQKWIDSVPQEERKRVESRIKAQYKKSWKSPLEIIRIVTDPGVENDPSKQAKSEWLAKYGMDGITAKDLRTALVKEAREQGWNREMYDSKGKLTAYGQRKLRLSRFIRKNNIE